MPKSTGIPKSIVADINRLKGRLNSLEKSQTSLTKDFKNTVKAHLDMIKKQQATISTLGKKAVKREKRKPSPYNLFLKDKMSQGMSMIEAVKAWKEKQSGTSSTSIRQPSQEWQQTTQQY